MTAAVLTTAEAARKRAPRRVLPGFRLTLGYTLFYLALIVLIPLSALIFKTFTLTLEQFTAFCLSHPDYLTAKGRHSRCLSIDRRDAKEGYHIWNIRLLTVGKNSERAANDTNRKRYGWQSTPAPSESESEDPF